MYLLASSDFFSGFFFLSPFVIHVSCGWFSLATVYHQHAMALAPVDLGAMQRLAQGWISKHPEVKILQLPRTRRLVDIGARAAFAVHTKPVFDENSEIKPAPCDLCGMWSKAFCEACDTSSQAPTGLCSICDRDHLVCWKCVNNNRSWEVAVAERASIHSGEHIEVSGFEDDQGVWTPLRPAVRVATADLNVQMDGSFDMQQLALRIREELHKREQ